MEFIINVEQFKMMNDNKIIGIPKLVTSEFTFHGINNILVCDDNITLENTKLNFYGNNSVVYLQSNLNDFNLNIYTDSTIFIGKNNIIKPSVTLNAEENQNIIICDDCIIGENVKIQNSDEYPIYSIDTKKRINFSNSIYLGDHIWIGESAYIPKGTRIGSGSIINSYSVLPSYSKIPSNVLISGNPAGIIKRDVFFTKEELKNYQPSNSATSQEYISDVFIYEVISKETLSINELDEILKELNVDKRVEFIQKLFIRNKRKNRFAIH